LADFKYFYLLFRLKRLLMKWPELLKLKKTFMKHLLLCTLSSFLLFFAKAQTISTIAGTGVAGFSGDGAAATAAKLNLSDGAAVDAAGNIYIADTYNHRIRKISTSGVISTIAGTGSGGYSGDNGPAASAQIYYPEAIALDAAGNIYIADFGNQVVRKIAKTGIITTFAGNGAGGYSGDGGPATSASLSGPYDVCADTAGNVIIADWRNNVIRKVNKAGVISTVAGTGVAGYNGDGITATTAQLNNPYGVTVDIAGNIYIGDCSNNRVRKVANGTITTIAGTGVAGNTGDGGAATSAKLSGPIGVRVDASGNLLIADFSNNKIRKVSGGTITTIAGNGTAGFSGDGGNPLAAQFHSPVRVVIDNAGNLLIADRDNNRIRKITYANAPTITSFSPTSGGNNTGITINGTGFTGATAVSFGGTPAKSFTINSDIKIIAKVAQAGSSGVVSVTTPSGTATKDGFTFCVTPSVKIAANITSPICEGTVVTFTATPTNGGGAPVYQWQKNHENVGTGATTYKDSMLHTGDTITCMLTSNASPCVTSSTATSNAIAFTVNPIVTPSVSIAANPGTAVCVGTKITFTATPANGGANPAYQWQRNGINVGSNSTTYIDSVPATGDSITVKLTSNAACIVSNPATSNALKVRVDVPTPIISITSNKTDTICAKTAVTFKAVVTPFYLWKKNGNVVGDASNTYRDTALKTNDFVQCTVVSSASACNNNTGNIVNSNKLSFTVKSAPAKPSAIVGPANVPKGASGIYFSVTAVDGVMYAWTLPAGAVIDSGQGGNMIKVTWGTTGGKVSVIAINNCGSSQAVSKTVGVTGKENKIALVENNTGNIVVASNDVKLSPNPAGAQATLTFTAKTADKYTITVTDAHSKVLEVKTGVSAKGVNTVKINTSKYAKGVYFVSIVSKDGGKKSKELVVGQQ